MARIRTIKPEFPQSESMGNVSRDARLTFILLWTLADDYGKLRGNSRMLASLLFPYDNDAPKGIERWLDELERQRCIRRYLIDGHSYILILNWTDHQKVDHPSKFQHPDPREDSEDLASPRESLGLDQGPRTKDQRTKESDTPRPKKVTLDDLSTDHIADWLAKKRTEGKYIDHDEHFILDYFKNYCRSKGKTYADYASGYRNAFEWDRCQPKPPRGPSGGWGTGPAATQQPTKDDRARAAIMQAAERLGFAD